MSGPEVVAGRRTGLSGDARRMVTMPLLRK